MNEAQQDVFNEINRLLHWWHTCPAAVYFEDEFEAELNLLLNIYAEEE